MKCICCRPAVAFGLSKSLDDLQELDNGAGPPVGHHKRGRISVAGPDMQEMDLDVVDVRNKLWPLVEPRCDPLPVVLVRPVLTE